MKHTSTHLLRAAVLCIALVILGICTFALPVAISSDNTGFYRPLIFGMYVPAIPFFYALYQAWKLLGYIDKNQAFSQLAVMALKNIKLCAIAIGALYTVGMPYIFSVGDRDDAPGILLGGLVIIGASFVIAAAAAVFEKVLQNAIDIKAENDLTV